MPAKVRLDQLLLSQGLAESRTKAQALILAGAVRIGDTVYDKPGTLVNADAALTLAERLPYVSRGGLKLAHALDAFGLDPAGLVALDVGASTGGFTDVLLQRGAAHVYAVDVGYGQLDYRLQQDPRVTVLDRTNIRHLTALPPYPAREQRDYHRATERTEDAQSRETTNRRDAEDAEHAKDAQGHAPERAAASGAPLPPSGGAARAPEPQASASLPAAPNCAVIDTAFISLRLVLPAVQRLIAADAWVVALIKPQFEAGPAQVGKGGVVRDPAVHKAVIKNILAAAAELGLAPHGLARSPITGPAGNVEFLVWLGGPGPTFVFDALP